MSVTVSGPSEVPAEPTSPEPTQTSCLQKSCNWTDWIDGSYPGADIDSGDFDTFQNLRSKGYKFCPRPSQVECRAARFPHTPLAALGQQVVCSNTVGLICLNRNQLPPICLNYQIRIQCCEWVHVCGDRNTSPTTSGATHSTTRETRTHTQASWTTGAPSTSTQHSSASSAHVPPTIRTMPSTVTLPGTSACQPQCTWTHWFDVDFPSPGPHGGDMETYSNIVRSGERVCRRPEYITHLECRAENHPGVSIATLGQVVQCRPDVGLVCRNRDQTGRFRMCLNYQVRVLCCEPREGCPLTPVTPYVVSPAKSWPTAESASVAPTVTSPSSAVPATPMCYCSVSDQLYPAGTCMCATLSPVSHPEHATVWGQGSLLSVRGVAVVTGCRGRLLLTHGRRAASLGAPAWTPGPAALARTRPLPARLSWSCRVHHIPADRPRRPLLLRHVHPGLPRGPADRPGLPHQRSAARRGHLPAWVLPVGPRACHYAGVPERSPTTNGNLPLPALLGHAACHPSVLPVSCGSKWATPRPTQMAQRGCWLRSGSVVPKAGALLVAGHRGLGLWAQAVKVCGVRAGAQERNPGDPHVGTRAEMGREGDHLHT